jgi:hypothetical protein
MLRTTLLCLLIVSAAAVPAQEPELVKGIVHDGDTIPWFVLDTVHVEDVMGAHGRRRQAKLDKLTRNVQKVYPYARVTAELLAEYENDLRNIARERDRDLYTRIAEAELRAEFEEEVKGLTVSQGRVLMKLIDRETGYTTYEVVKELRGGFQAWLWQGVARLFGNDMKEEYDPGGDDSTVEHIVQRIERGELGVMPRTARTAKAQQRLEKRKARLYKRYGITASK